LYIVHKKIIHMVDKITLKLAHKNGSVRKAFIKGLISNCVYNVYANMHNLIYTKRVI
jgi:hypothetical protein